MMDSCGFLRQEHPEHAGALLLLPFVKYFDLLDRVGHRWGCWVVELCHAADAGIGSLILVEQHESPSYCLAFFPQLGRQLGFFFDDPKLRSLTGSPVTN